jgi:ABC-2 type transport system permease protein
MWNKLIAAVIKESKLLFRDKMGMAILFLMPVLLILVMTLIQDATFKSINEKGIPVVLVNEDKDSLGFAIRKGLMESDLCTLSEEIDGKPATKENAQKAVASGRFIIGVVIPKDATKAIRSNVEHIVNETVSMDGENTKVNEVDSFDITLFIDPVAKKSFVSSVTSSLHEFISETKTQIMFQSFSEQIAVLLPEEGKIANTAYKKVDMINYKEVYGSDKIGTSVPNSVQHNVPAWTIFGMFFIVISVVNNVMKEKKEGSSFRLKTMPTSYILSMNGKIIVYVMVCFTQFLLMLAVGIFILPFLGLPPLDLGSSVFAVLFLALCTAFAATGFGVLIGTLASSEHQGAITGSLSILLLSAIGGILVPTYVMPEMIRQVSVISPLNWSLEGFYSLYLRNGGFVDILPYAIQLISFFIVMMAISSVANRMSGRV